MNARLLRPILLLLVAAGTLVGAFATPASAGGFCVEYYDSTLGNVRVCTPWD